MRTSLFRNTKFWAGIIALLTFIVYAPSLSNAFVSYDDGLLITGNPLVQRMSPFTVWQIFTSYDPQLYIPLTLLMYQIENALFGFNPTVFHVTSLMIHIGNALLVFSTIKMLRRSPLPAGEGLGEGHWMAVFCTLIFALHPLNTEAVAWAAARKDLLSAFFCLLSLNLYLRYRTEGVQKLLRLSIIFFALGLLSKVVILLLPLVLLAIDYKDERPLRDEALLEKIPYFGLSVIFGIVAMMGKTAYVGGISAWETILVAGKSVVFTLQKLIIPTGLGAIYPQTTPITLSSAEFAVPMLIVLGLLITLFCIRKRHPMAFVAGVFALCMYAPSAVNFSSQGYIFFSSDRYAYLPSIGIIFLLFLLINKIQKNSARTIHYSLLTINCLIVVFAVLGFLSFKQSQTWQNSTSLYTNVLAHYPDAAVAHLNLGSVYVGEGNTDAALAEFQEAESLKPGHSAALNIGIVHHKRGDIDAARSAYQRAVDLVREYESVMAVDLISYYFLADLQEKLGDDATALALYQEAAELGRAYAEPQVNLGIAYQKRGKLDDAIDAYQRAIENDSRHILAHYHLSAVLAETGQLEEAAKSLKRVIQMNPEYEQAQRHLMNLERMMQ